MASVPPLSGAPPEHGADPAATDAPAPAGEQPPASSSDYDSAEEWATAPAADAAVAAPSVKAYTANDEAERELAGEDVVITFRFPDGSEPPCVTRVYPQGQTIAYIKGHLEDLYGFPYERTNLTMGGSWLMDPLSLNDLPFTAGGPENVVDVGVAPAE